MLYEINDLRTEVPGGAFYLMPNCGVHCWDAASPMAVRSTHRGIWLRIFWTMVQLLCRVRDFPANHFFRMSIATSEANICEGTNRKKSAIEALT